MTAEEMSFAGLFKLKKKNIPEEPILLKAISRNWHEKKLGDRSSVRNQND
jgi:hypothetical protein